MGDQPGPHVDLEACRITFLVDAVSDTTPVSVWYHLRDFGSDPAFRRSQGDRWVATIPLPPVDRLEYLLVLRSADGTESMVVDPANPSTVQGAFGDKSVLELPGYRPPGWLSITSPAWPSEPVEATTDVPGVTVAGELLTPPGQGADDALPLLVVHDGPEYGRLARLGDYLDWLSLQEPALTCRVLLLQPDDRNLSYAASAAYTEALVLTAIPLARQMAATVGETVGLGASLGALALAHAAVTHPGTFGGLCCQSGSFFLPRFDAHERRFRYYDRVVEAVQRIHADPSALAGVAVAVTAGVGEENLENNRALADRLAQAGVHVTYAEGRDGHSYTAWRDLLDPSLGDLLRRTWLG